MKKLVWSSLLMASLLIGTTSLATDTTTSSSVVSSTEKVADSGTQTSETTTPSDSKELATVKSDVSLTVTAMINDGKLAQFQYEDLMTRLKNATTVSDAQLVLSDAKQLAKNNEDLYQGSFDEKVYNTKEQLKLLVQTGRLTQQQADDFIAKIDKSTTIDELDTIWSEIEGAAKKATESSSSTESSTSSSTETSKTKDSTKTKEDLPKTGEKTSNIALYLGAITSFIAACALMKKKTC